MVSKRKKKQGRIRDATTQQRSTLRRSFETHGNDHAKSLSSYEGEKRESYGQGNRKARELSRMLETKKHTARIRDTLTFHCPVGSNTTDPHNDLLTSP